MKLNIILSSLVILAGSSFISCQSQTTPSSVNVAKIASAAAPQALNAVFNGAFNTVSQSAFKIALNVESQVQPKLKRRSGIATSYVIDGQRYNVLKSAVGYNRKGVASWYGPGFQKRLTSSDTIYNMYAMTAASPILPLNTYVKVTDLKNHHSVIVKVTDRGPFAKNRIMDLSYAAAKKLNMVNAGTAYVDIKAINSATLHGQPSILV
jgi:rare lipoprotein A